MFWYRGSTNHPKEWAARYKCPQCSHAEIQRRNSSGVSLLYLSIGRCIQTPSRSVVYSQYCPLGYLDTTSSILYHEWISPSVSLYSTSRLSVPQQFHSWLVCLANHTQNAPPCHQMRLSLWRMNQLQPLSHNPNSGQLGR